MRRGILGGLLTAVAALAAATPAAAIDTRFTASDGVELQATITGREPLAPRPVVVEFSPYGRASGTLDAGPAYNHLLIQIRGTGDSDGSFDALGPRTQADVEEVLRWACAQQWSDGRLALNGFSASAITIYNSLHRELPCVRAAVLKSGTFELYRDLLYPGAINNIAPGTGVMALIGAPALAQSPSRLDRPATGLTQALGLVGAGLSDVQHPTLDAWWRERGFRGDANDLPVLVVNGFFDVESRGAFQGYQELRADGARMIVVGAHDGAPDGTDAGLGTMRGWLDHYVLGVENGVEQSPRVRLLLADGDREDFNAGHFVPFEGDDWPVPGTRWHKLALRGSSSVGGGTLTLATPKRVAVQSYPAAPSFPLNSDPPNAAIVGVAGLNALTTAMPVLSDMTLAGKTGLAYVSRPLNADVLAAGPGSLELVLSSTAPQTNIWAVLSDVWPDGTPHPLTAGRLNSDFPRIDRDRSLIRARTGDVLQPYGRFNAREPAKAGEERRYFVELWPVGNRFKRGHRLRLDVLGASAASLPSAPAINSIRVGGPGGSRLLLPALPGSDLRAALRR